MEINRKLLVNIILIEINKSNFNSKIHLHYDSYVSTVCGFFKKSGYHKDYQYIMKNRISVYLHNKVNNLQHF